MAIRKSETLRAPLDARGVVALERMLQTLHAQALQARTFTYTGDGRAGKIIPLDIPALFVMIYAFKAPGDPTSLPGNAGFAIRGANGIAYVPGNIGDNLTPDAIEFVDQGIRLGANIEVNEAGRDFIGLALG